jgi:dynein light intermediate chain 1
MAGPKDRRRESERGSPAEGGPGEEGQENLWSSLLGEVQTSRTSLLPTTRALLVLGDKESGKTTLIAKLQGNEDPKKGSGLEYGYIDVRDEYRDDHTRLSHWILDGDHAHANLLNFALTERNYEDTTVLINVSMTTPWNMMDQLQNWASLLQDHIDKLKLTAEQVKQLQAGSWRRWQTYTEPGDEQEASSPTKRTSRTVPGGEPLQEELEPLPEGTLARNLGLDLVVVVTKTDYMADLEKDFDYKDEHFDFIQQAVGGAERGELILWCS